MADYILSVELIDHLTPAQVNSFPPILYRKHGWWVCVGGGKFDACPESADVAYERWATKVRPRNVPIDVAWRMAKKDDVVFERLKKQEEEKRRRSEVLRVSAEKALATRKENAKHIRIGGMGSAPYLGEANLHSSFDCDECDLPAFVIDALRVADLQAEWANA